MLRKATKKDKEQWVRLNREIAEFDVRDDNLWGQIDHAKDEELAEVFSDALSNPQQITIFMIEEEGQVIGFANTMTIFSIWSEGYALAVEEMYIRDDMQGRGLGKKAIKELEDYARTSGYRRLQFQSENTSPQAEKLYGKLGYKPVSVSFYARYL